MSRFLPTAGVMLGAVLLQVAVAPHLAIGGVVPNLLLLVVLTLALVEGRTAGCVAGFTAGLLFDLLGSGPIGVAALVFCVVGYFVGSIQENIFAEGWRLPLTVVFLGTLFAELAYLGALALVGQGMGFWGSFTTVVLPAAIYNGVLALLLYPLLARFLRHERTMTTFGRIG